MKNKEEHYHLNEFWPLSHSDSDEHGEQFVFLRGYHVESKIDLRPVTKRFKEGIVLCSADLVAGPMHVRRISVQAWEYWRRGYNLARNKSIDLLMRVTCQSQIASATRLSNLIGPGRVVLFGIVQNKEDAEEAEEILIKFEGGIRRDDAVSRLTREKASKLRNLHKIPFSCTKEMLINLLQEKSILLSFEK